MKKNILILLLLLYAQGLYAQEQMTILLVDGTPLTYIVDSIQKMRFSHTDTFPQYSKMYVDANVSTLNPQDYKTASIDSMIFYKDTSHNYHMGFYSDTLGMFMTYQLTGPHIFGYKAPIDSIKFAEYQMDTNIIQLTARSINSFNCAVWVDDRIYFTQPSGYFDMDSSDRIIRDSIYSIGLYTGLTFSENLQGNKFLCVDTRQFAYDNNTSVGYLVESDVQSITRDTLLGTVDSGVSSAVYYSNDSIIYYSYGNIATINDTSNNAGYYLFDRSTGKSTLICNYLSEIGPSEMVNGFDISPDRKKLLIPSVSNKGALLIEFDLVTHLFDTLKTAIYPGLSRNGLWVRYNHDGAQILYCNYAAAHLFGDYTSEIGIIDRASLARKVLNINPTNEGTWISIFPSWSPDDKKIVYCAAPVGIEPSGALGSFEICILKTLQ